MPEVRVGSGQAGLHRSQEFLFIRLLTRRTGVPARTAAPSNTIQSAAWLSSPVFALFVPAGAFFVGVGAGVGVSVGAGVGVPVTGASFSHTAVNE